MHDRSRGPQKSVVALALAFAAACAACAPPEHSRVAMKSGGARAYALEALVGAPRHRDVARALVLLRVACARGDLRACVERGIALQIYDGRASAIGEAWRVLEDACQRPTKTACEDDANALASRDDDARASRGDGASMSRIENAFISADICGKNTVEMLACYNLSRLYARGVVGAPDSADAAVLTKRACAGGFKRECE